MIFELVEKERSAICEKILRSLPNWFGIESATKAYIDQADSMPMIVAKKGSEVVGFLTLNSHNSWTSEIHVMGVLPEYHGRGVGRGLVDFAERSLKERGARFLTVKTLSESRPDPYYDRTRAFYLGVGFFPVEEFKTLWGEHNPCLLLIKPL